MLRVLITGGMGFIGSNAARKFSEAGWHVEIVDNLSRTSARENMKWLSDNNYYSKYHFLDMKNSNDLNSVIATGQYDLVIHLAAQVAVTSSILNPKNDFECNATGTFYLIEAIRRFSPQTVIIYASTNKVYGELNDLALSESQTRYDTEFDGISELFKLDLHTPYSCSKGLGDMYLNDYIKVYNLRGIVFRQSCIYGERQFGVEDQGWLAWFCIANLGKYPLTIFGDGKQVRDLLYVDDLLDAYMKVFSSYNNLKSHCFNIGGGKQNSLSLIETARKIENITGSKYKIKFEKPRTGDQKYFISDNSNLMRSVNWSPETSIDEGINKLIKWLKSDKSRIIK